MISFKNPYISKKDRNVIHRAENVIENLRESEYEAWRFYKKAIDKSNADMSHATVEKARAAWQSLYMLAKQCGIATQVEITERTQLN